LEGFEDDQSTDTEVELTENTGLGSIQSVQLCNFMCHSFLKVDLGDKINFITGQNGSGKSAILTAIAIALGGKAKFTNRASSISKLLKEGEEYVFN
jgi:DNA repair exonuclease SbcCD ATPase subunit